MKMPVNAYCSYEELQGSSYSAARISALIFIILAAMVVVIAAYNESDTRIPYESPTEYSLDLQLVDSHENHERVELMYSRAGILINP